jgi:hypothetical protein
MTNKICLAFDYIFPNFILPNALNPDIGIINYIAAKYNNNEKGDNGFTYTENNNNEINKIFNYPNYNKQNSLTGFFIEAEVYNGKIDFEYESIFFTVLKNKKFLYIIKPDPVLLFTFGGDINNQEWVNGNYFWKYISKSALEQIKMGNGIIVIDYSLEPVLKDIHCDALNNCLKFSGIDKDSIYIIVNGFNAKEYYENKIPLEERKFNVLNTGFVIEHSSYFYQKSLNQNKDLVMTADKFLSTKNILRKNHFLMKINNIKKHRIKILIRMIDDDLINLGDWSFSGKNQFTDTDDFKDAIENEKIENIDKIIQLLKNGPYKLQNEQNYSGGVNYDWYYSNNYEANINSYFDICFESFFYENKDILSLTEKIFKAMVCFQPFIFVTTKGTLKLLRDLGYKTFEPFINESYDNEDDDDKRLLMIYDEIKKLCSMDKNEIHNWYWGMEEILIHNHNHHLSIHKNRMITEDSVDYLIKKLYNI